MIGASYARMGLSDLARLFLSELYQIPDSLDRRIGLYHQKERHDLDLADRGNTFNWVVRPVREDVGTDTERVVDPINRVYPSGFELVTAPAPIMPPAPGRFSTTTGWPRISLMGGAIMRAVTSRLPPGANGTTIRIG